MSFIRPADAEDFLMTRSMLCTLSKVFLRHSIKKGHTEILSSAKMEGWNILSDRAPISIN